MFGVVIPLFNNERTIKTTLDSVLSQSYRHFELIVVDDGSTDGGPAIVSQYSDPRIQLLSKRHAGEGPARNSGIAASRCEWIAFLDADDFWFDDHLEELAAVRCAHPEAVLIGTAHAVARVDAGLPKPREQGREIKLVRYFDAIGRGEAVLNSSTAALRKSAWQETGGFRPLPSGADSEMWVRLALCGPVAASSKITAIYQTGTGGVSERQQTRWLGKPLKTIADLSPAVAVLVPELGKSAGINGAPQRYIERSAYWCLHGSARAGDIPTLRALRKLPFNRFTLAERLILTSSLLPSPIARACHRVIYVLQAIRRRLPI